MLIKIKKFDNYFFLYLSLLFLFGIFWLYIKHSVGNDSTISEWIINYQGGFIKRGLIGEICFQIAIYFDLNLRFVIFQVLWVFKQSLCRIYKMKKLLGIGGNSMTVAIISIMDCIYTHILN